VYNYEWTADDRLCSWMETRRRVRMNYEQLYNRTTVVVICSFLHKRRIFNRVYNRTCSRNISDATRPTSLRPVFINGMPINQPSPAPVTPPHVFLMHIHRDAVVTRLGDVISGRLKLVLYACSNDVKRSLPPHLDRIPLYNEVFVISQFWGTGVFHRMVEIVPRIVLFVDFLKANPGIRILAPEVGGRLAQLLGIIGLERLRLISGVARANIVYQPRSTRCGFPNVQEVQTLSQLYHRYIERSFPRQPRKRLILIRRSTSRRFSEQREIEAALKRAAADFNVTYTRFIDNPTPSLNETMTQY